MWNSLHWSWLLAFLPAWLPSLHASFHSVCLLLCLFISSLLGFFHALLFSSCLMFSSKGFRCSFSSFSFFLFLFYKMDMHSTLIKTLAPELLLSTSLDGVTVFTDSPLKTLETMLSMLQLWGLVLDFLDWSKRGVVSQVPVFARFSSLLV